MNIITQRRVSHFAVFTGYHWVDQIEKGEMGEILIKKRETKMHTKF
jgi:hypothetical protein